MNQPQYSNTGRPTVRIAVYLMTGVFLTMEIEQNATAQQILSIVQSEAELGISRFSLATTTPVFALWMCSSQLEVQLRPTHKPVELAAKWNYLVNKYSSEDSDDEEPLLHFRRNIFLSRSEEEQIKDTKVLELLYAEARFNVLQGRKRKE
jgi:FERM domain-containing protein 8